MENEQDKSTTFFRFEDLRIYHKSLDYIKWLYEMASRETLGNIGLHFFTKYLDAAQAISLNIAEGSSRNKSQFIYYLKMAKSSVRECVVFSTTGHQKGYLNDEEYDISKNYLMEMTKMIGALIGSLQRSTKDLDSDPDNDPNSY